MVCALLPATAGGTPQGVVQLARPFLAPTLTTTAPTPSMVSTLALGRLANFLDIELVPHATVDGLVRLQLDLRDLLHGAEDRLSAWSLSSEVPVANLAILTTEPLADQLSKSSGYGWRSDPIHHNRRFHHGTDMRAPHGTPVMVAGDGVVVFAGRQGGYGNVIYVDHGGGIVTRYGHLQHIDTRSAASVTAGQRIGRVGSSGRATGPHLHFEVRIDGRDVDPITAMSVADLQRTSPELGRIAAYALSPELQRNVVSTEDIKREALDKSDKSDKAGKPVRTKRAQILW
ncbi:MAG: M23 family metallopeptidase [Proteobacteria bacterium]|nr:M23 family metallopeptidase [Pseudomonadota bacterium]